MVQIQLPPLPDPPAIPPPPRLRVSVRAAWGDAWEEFPYLTPIEAVDCASPGIPHARFLYRAGRVLHEDVAGYEQADPPDLVDWFVRIDLLGTPPDPAVPGDPGEADVLLWLGQICAQDAAPLRTPGDDPTAAGGDYHYTAYGLQHLMDRTPLLGGYVINAGNTAALPIDHLPIFNERYKRGLSNLGNRHGSVVPSYWGNGSSYVFGSAGWLWNNQQILDYVLACYPPGGPGLGDIDPEISGTPENLAQITLPRLQLPGHSLKAAIDKLVDPKRALGWCLRFDESSGGDQPIVHVFSSLGAAVTIPAIPGSGEQPTTILPNYDQAELRLDDQTDVDSVVLTLDAAASYDGICVRGARLKSVFTLAVSKGNLLKGWTDSEEGNYRTADDAERSLDKYAHVYTRFRASTVWDWTCPSFIGGSTTAGNANPLLKDDGTLDSAQQGNITPGNSGTHPPLRHLPGVAKPYQLAGAPTAYREAFALIENPAVPGAYVYVDKLSALKLGNISVHLSDHDLALELKCEPNHRLALNHFVGAATTAKQPQVDWEKLIVTLACETDERLQVIEWITPGTGGTDRPGRMLVIDIPGAEAWWIASNTVTEVGADPSTAPFVLHVNGAGRGTLLRDDSQDLRVVARLAREWYGTQRHAVTLSLKRIEPAYPVGTYLRAVSNAAQTLPVESVITSKRYDFEHFTTEVRTQFAELDFAVFGKGG